MDDLEYKYELHINFRFDERVLILNFDNDSSDARDQLRQIESALEGFISISKNKIMKIYSFAKTSVFAISDVLYVELVEKEVKEENDASSEHS